MLLPRHCAVCLQPGASLCGPCADQLRPPVEAPRIAGLDRCVALFSYEGAGRAVIARLKFANHRDCLRPFAVALAASIDAGVDTGVDLVTWVPTSQRRRRERGYDQAELIARCVGRALHVPVRPVLRPVRRAAGSSVQGPQTGRTRHDRFATRFEVRPWHRPTLGGGTIAIVDDVRTTGASLGAAGRAVLDAGATFVIGATLAATP